jgi:DNA modification methylase
MAKINDLDIEKGGWRALKGVVHTGSLWLHKSRGAGGSAKYPGNFLPEIPWNAMMRYTKANDLVVDLFAGSETTADVAATLGRRYEGCDLRPNSARTSQGDARTWKPSEPPKLVILHPPYADIIKYSEKLKDPRAEDLSLSWQEFLQPENMGAVVDNAWDMLAEGGHLVLVIGDLYQKSAHVPLAYKTYDLFEKRGFVLKASIVKDFGTEIANKGKNQNIWYYRSLKGGFVVLDHEHIFVLRKPFTKKTRKKKEKAA